jgi:oxygen-independent coproporphyrinogen III oxidase
MLATHTENPFGIYVHIPFCKQKCHYCAFVSSAPTSNTDIDRYMRSLHRHLALAAPVCRNRHVSSIFLGGGTPSFLGPARLEALFTLLFSQFNIIPHAEITVEVNPESASRELLQTLHAVGVNRLSFGVQSFSNEILTRLGRIHSKEEVLLALHHARQVGFTNLSIDLMYGLPNQDIQDWQSTLDQAIRLQPEHLSVYGLSFEEGTPFDQWRKKGTMTPVLDETFETMYHLTEDRLAENSWQPYEISNWCQPGKECRHNILYWDRHDYAAFGVAAHGFYNGLRYGIIESRAEYSRVMEEPGLQKDVLPSSKLAKESRHLTIDEMGSDAMIFGLRMTNGISISAFQSRFGFSPLARWQKAITRLCGDGLLEHRGDTLRLTKEAILISNTVFYHFLD